MYFIFKVISFEPGIFKMLKIAIVLNSTELKLVISKFA